jgi:NAD(P)-dependent dehydrogenase (short-subunit alcohol dehydrogenase family)
MGILGLVNTIKQEVRKDDIKVNTVAPIAFTRMTEGIMAPERAKIAKPECVATLVLYFCWEQCRIQD